MAGPSYTDEIEEAILAAALSYRSFARLIEDLTGHHLTHRQIARMIHTGQPATQALMLTIARLAKPGAAVIPEETFWGQARRRQNPPT